MGESYNFKQLKFEILALSRATDWDTARKEWALVEIDEVQIPEACLCGCHCPIIEVCEIFNRITGHSTEVGNICVKRFLGIRSDLIFKALKRIRKDNQKSLNEDAIVFFKDKGLFNDWEYAFLHNTKRKRNLSAKQLEHRLRINRKVLAAISQRGFQGSSI